MLKEDRTDQLRILFVCSGNICRSPMADRLGTSFLKGSRKIVHISSAGTLDLRGFPAAAHACTSLAEWGIDLSNHRSKGIGQLDLEDFDHLVVMAPEHEAELLAQSPQSHARIVRLWNYSSISSQLGEIPDPVGKGLGSFEMCRDLIAECLENWLMNLD